MKSTVFALKMVPRSMFRKIFVRYRERPSKFRNCRRFHVFPNRFSSKCTQSSQFQRSECSCQTPNNPGSIGFLKGASILILRKQLVSYYLLNMDLRTSRYLKPSQLPFLNRNNLLHFSTRLLVIIFLMTSLSFVVVYSFSCFHVPAITGSN